MINVFKKIWVFSGAQKGKIKSSIIIGFINAIFNALQLTSIFVVLKALVDNDNQYKIAAIAFSIMIISIIGKIITSYLSQLKRTYAGYFMVAKKRIEIGNKLKVVPMGYFNRNSLGNITGVATTILSDVETTAPMVLITTLGGVLNSIVFAIAILIFDWRIGLIVIAGILGFLLLTSFNEKRFLEDAPKRQKAQEALVEAVLETVQGISVVKAFNLDNQNDKKVDRAINESCCKNIAMEKAITPYVTLQQVVLKLFSIAIIVVSILLHLNENMSLVYCLMMIVSSFMVFDQIEVAGRGATILRLTEASIDRANEIENVPTIDEAGKDLTPKNHNISFKNVSFAYEKRSILEDVSLEITEKTMTAIIGPSGSGKTTLCNLIARFWDVNKGSVSIGGYDVKNYNLDSLMKNISMVFQNVYLFEDTIENNIKFGKPNATYEEVILAAKKACCDDFISKLPNGYKTVIGEGGESLSGGEKQRISIARAILKDAPIIIFDEATANIDPENEDKLQGAIEALTKDKTIVVIAHRLKTVENANQILVLNGGRIVQKGSHRDLIRKKGIYADFINRRKEVIGWKLKSNK